MSQPNRFFAFSALEVFLPLLFLSGSSLFIAAAFIPAAAGLTLVLLELVRRQPPFVMNAAYLICLAACGLAGWYFLKVPPYWIWSAHILVSETARRPSEAQRKRPAGFGFKKYAAKRIKELFMVFVAALAAAGSIYFLKEAVSGPAVWMLAILAFAAAQIFLDGTKEVKA